MRAVSSEAQRRHATGRRRLLGSPDRPRAITSTSSSAPPGRCADRATTPRTSCRRRSLNVLKRPRLLRDDNEIGYLMRALRNTHASWYRTHRPPARRPPAARGRRASPTSRAT